MQRAQRRARRTEIGAVAEGPGDLQRAARDVAAHQLAIVGVDQRRRNAERRRGRERAALAVEEVAGKRTRPPRHLVEPAQHARYVAAFAAEGAALDGGEHIGA